GDLVWEKFGHNAVGVRDARAGTDIVYNWGMFSFDQPGFVPRLLRGEMMYWMAPFDASQMAIAYIGMNRSVTIQELNLEPAARLALRDFLEWNARDENKFYRYDYFRDNCSTRARDAIDRATGGALRKQLEAIPTSLSYRDHALRLTQDDLLTATGIDIGLGLPTDRRLNAWEESFIPMSLQERIRAIRIPQADGKDAPLVRGERTLFSSTRTPEAATPANRAPWFFLFSAGVALIVVILAMRAGRGLRWARVLTLTWCVAWTATVGLLGSLLVLLWTATVHEATYRNMNLFHFQPLWLAVAIAALVAAMSSPKGPLGAAGSVVRVGAMVSGVLSLVGFVALAVPAMRQGYGAPVALAAPLNLAATFALLRLFPRSAAAPVK
ncbi:MAG: DUF4105 domain-containing protein, partial [Gemmatimonadaceae bacterium]